MVNNVMSSSAQDKDQDVLFDEDDQKQSQNQEEKTRGPIDQVKAGSVRIDVWKNEGENGSYLSFDMKRFYTQDDGETFKDTSRMRERDLTDAAMAWNRVAQKYGVETVKKRREFAGQNQ